MTAWVTVSPKYDSASRFSFWSVRALISCAVYFLPSMSIFQSVPMWRLTERIVRSGLVMAWRLATSPTRTSPVFENATTDGVVRPPSELGATTGSPASRTATTELVVPRSIPTALDMDVPPDQGSGGGCERVRGVLRPTARAPEPDLSVTLSTFMRVALFPARTGVLGARRARPWQDARHGPKRLVRRHPGDGAPLLR